ncbi:proton-translocating NADH-quinone oxidoreductase, chain N [Solidesulfovibrio carbinoliphilus subsp. oakridgensis]|uniref:NADH-quinone oxidoreductase subunit N n=1 Tax=Solidesulfovibrio carbinoliphilus subsp. oakridgensis TaxID=694327 RepID=G7QBU1_9BACT|nr:NADH-quinone oxidoreductase subunit N [Solidesulfovibrio carbinoliphilus]EHJ49434.1 proton-translocating NADH-quinone oxidoreductase, chain N [Solidesulfovibrio carbinoliphilus subsp. oakridgensis]
MTIFTLLPELWLLGLVCALFVASVRGKKSVMAWLPAAAGVGVLVAMAGLSARGDILYGTYKLDALSQFFKLVIAFGFAVVTGISAGKKEDNADLTPDYFMLLGLSAWGLMLLASCVELVTLYLALELSSYSLYALIPLRGQDRRAAEAGIKYILFGAAVTALALFGLSYIMAAKHTTSIAALAATPWSFSEAPLAVLGLTLFLAGFFYKLALFPFHFWCPDVYQGTKNETAAYVATIPKLGAVVVLVRLAAFFAPHMELTNILAILGAASMTFGNLAALVQRDLKRLLGFSSVAHAGYVMLGLAAGSAAGLSAAAFYSLAYILMNLAAFYVVCAMSPKGENPSLDDLDGLYKRAPALAMILAVAAFALVGLPPTAGFTGKLFLLSAAWDQGYHWLVIVAVLNTAISIYYYLGMVRHAYTGESDAPALAIPRSSLVFGGVLAALVLLLGMMPAPLYDLAAMAGTQLHP